jgi:sRNA-binding regulator protein Hfq
LALGALVLPSITLAQHEHRATVLLRNGDRVEGLLEDVENGTVFVRRSLHDQQRIGIGNVALIDLVGGASGLPETELSMARGGNHVVFLRNGTNFSGQFVDIRGGEANASAGENHSLIFRTSNGEERRVPLDTVGRIYLGNFPGATTANASTSNEPLPAGAMRVPGNATWVATPLSVRRGDQVRFNVTGRIQLSDDGEDVAHSAGSLRQRRAPGSPLPQNFAGALIAKVGNSAPFPIGDVTTAITMPADGQLYLGINDDEVADNRGEYTVTMHHTRGTRR